MTCVSGRYTFSLHLHEDNIYRFMTCLYLKYIQIYGYMAYKSRFKHQSNGCLCVISGLPMLFL